MSRRILVASDGSAESLGALRLARELHERDGGEVEVLAVVEPLPVFDTGFMVALPEAELLVHRREDMRSALLDVVRDLGEGARNWEVTVATGVAAASIAERARVRRADLVVAGLGRHGAIDRFFGTETVLQLLHLVHAPVLAVPESASRLPSVAVVAVDFSSFGGRAARAGVDLVGPDAPVHLVHVLTGSERVPEESGDWRGPFEADARGRLAALAEELGLGDDRTTVHLVEGDPAGEVLAVARAVGADLVVAGSHGHSFMGRLLAGSVSTRLVRSADVPVLVVPPVGAPDDSGQVGSGSGASEAGHAPGWSQVLEDFSARHAGRAVDLDVGGPAWRGRYSGRDLPLMGVHYDARAHRVEIMLGEHGARAPHITHCVPGACGARLVAAAEEGAESLEIEISEGQVTVTLKPSPASRRAPARED
ncbi:MAG TPA: universal stress protein [Longimicrobiales bacterium]